MVNTDYPHDVVQARRRLFRAPGRAERRGGRALLPRGGDERHPQEPDGHRLGRRAGAGHRLCHARRAARSGWPAARSAWTTTAACATCWSACAGGGCGCSWTREKSRAARCWAWTRCPSGSRWPRRWCRCSAGRDGAEVQTVGLGRVLGVEILDERGAERPALLPADGPDPGGLSPGDGPPDTRASTICR